MIRSGEASMIFHVAEDGEHISDIHLARIMVKLVRKEQIKFHEKMQNVHSLIMQLPSLIFEKVGKLYEIGKGFTSFNCKDTHLKVFIDRRAFNSLCGELLAGEMRADNSPQSESLRLPPTPPTLTDTQQSSC